MESRRARASECWAPSRASGRHRDRPAPSGTAASAEARQRLRRRRARADDLARTPVDNPPSVRDPLWSKYEELDELDRPLLDEIDHFFRVYKELETTKGDTRGFGGRAEAEQVIADARARRDGAPTR